MGTTDNSSDHRTDSRIVGLLRRSSAPLGVGELAERLRLHPNGVRQHLHRLEARGLVHGTAAHGAVGRPRVLWSATPRAVAEAELPHTGWAMARSLARAIPASRDRLAEVEEAGIAMGRELVDDMGTVSTDGDAVRAALDALGFAPRRRADGAVTRYTLRTCPYAEAVRENPAVVCTLHKGVVRGVLDRLRPEAELTGFEPRPPDIAGCIVEITAPPGAEAGT